MNSFLLFMSSTRKYSVRTIALLSALFFALPVMAHSHINHLANGFWSGLLHPFMGWDHLLVALAVGILASQHRARARWIFSFAFPLMMVVGALLGSPLSPLPGVEWNIALSVFAMGVLIACAIKLSIPVGVTLIALFAMAHGYTHVLEMPTVDFVSSYYAGLLVSTVLLHLLGLSLCLLANKKNATLISRLLGVCIAGAGTVLLFGVA
jgi:urease accessory protein